MLDIDEFYLFSELNILRKIIGLENYKPIDIFHYIKIIDSFSNRYIAYKLMLIISLPVSSVTSRPDIMDLINIIKKM